MPRVEVNYNEKRLSIANNLEGLFFPTIIAEALHVESNPDGHLTPGDVEVKFSKFGPLDITNGNDLTVTVFANNYPERAANLQTERVPKISEAIVEKYGQSVKFCVYVLLGVGGFVEYKGR
jgi:hypothetical protein